MAEADPDPGALPRGDAPAEPELPPPAATVLRPHSPREALLLLLVSGALFAGTLALPEQKGLTLVGDVTPALRALAWIAPAYLVLARRGRDPLLDHAVLTPIRGLVPAAALSLLVLGLYVLGFAALQRHEGRVAHFLGALNGSDLVLLALQQAVLVALHEEYFFRGVLQPSLDRPEGPQRRLLGAPFGRGALLAAALFALCHLIARPEPAMLLRFFPALWFAWLRARTGSIVPGVIAHALANTVEHACYAAYWGTGPA